MLLREACRLLAAEVIWGEECLEIPIETACGADLMSDVLAYTKGQTLLLTGLTHVQVVRTADISDLAAIVFVRGKRPDAAVVALAAARRIPLLLTELTLFESCGILFAHGVKGCARRVMALES